MIDNEGDIIVVILIAAIIVIIFIGIPYMYSREQSRESNYEKCLESCDTVDFRDGERFDCIKNCNNVINSTCNGKKEMYA